MKCTNSMRTFLNRGVALLCVASLLFLMPGCGGREIPLAYDLDSDVSSFRISDDSAGTVADSFAQDLCVTTGDVGTDAADVDTEALTAAGLFDLNNHEVLYARNIHERLNPASLTKVMTAVVVLDHVDALDDVVEAPADMFPALWEQNASMAGLQPGESATVEDMLYGLMLPSGADCAIALARYVAGDVEAFVELMNRTAAALGMSGTHFTNPTGLHDADHYSTARDMTTLFAHAMRNDTFRTIAGSRSHTMPSASLHDGDLTVASTVFEELGTPLVACGWLVAGKTGYTREAGLCLATAARFGVRTYILVTAGAPGDHATSQADADDARYVYGQIPGL